MNVRFVYQSPQGKPILSLSQLLQLKHQEPLIITLARVGVADLPEEVPTLEQVFPGIAQRNNKLDDVARGEVIQEPYGRDFLLVDDYQPFLPPASISLWPKHFAGSHMSSIHHPESIDQKYCLCGYESSPKSVHFDPYEVWSLAGSLQNVQSIQTPVRHADKFRYVYE